MVTWKRQTTNKIKGVAAWYASVETYEDFSTGAKHGVKRPQFMIRKERVPGGGFLWRVIEFGSIGRLFMHLEGAKKHVMEVAKDASLYA